MKTLFSLILLLCPAIIGAYEPQFSSSDTEVNQNFRNVAAELKNLQSDSITVTTLTVNSDSVVLLAATQTLTGTLTINPSSHLAFGTEFHNSSSTVFAAGYSTSQTSRLACVTSSTLTITTNGGRVMVGFSGAISNTGVATQWVGYGIDGIPTGYPYSGCTNLSADIRCPASFTFLTPVLSAGSHSFCLYLFTSAGTTYLTNEAWGQGQFWVQELR